MSPTHNFTDATRQPLYSVGRAHRLTGVPAQTIKRWLQGYSYHYKDEMRSSSPKVGADRPVLDGETALSFRDLVEVRVANALRTHGFGWKTILAAAELGRSAWGTDSPFALRRLRTDGRLLFVEAAEQTGEPIIFRLGSKQLELGQVIAQSLTDVIDFTTDGDPLRWYPLGREAQIVVDPAFARGNPIIGDRQVPVDVLVKSLRAEGSAERVASMFRVSPEAVLAARDFEERLAA